MRIAISLCLATLVLAMGETSLSAPSGKGSRPGVTRPATAAEAAAAARVGGDTFDTALPITSTPFTDTGSTVGYADDYDAFCGISLGTAPDVVYAFTPPATGWFRFDLCGSSYDTKMYVYDDGGALLACNDDFDWDADESDPCFLNARIADFSCTGGTTYYLVVDGYLDAAGDYTLTVSTWTHCDVVPDVEATLEGEPELLTGQIDAHNCGCSCDGEALYSTIVGDASGTATVALRHGWRLAGFRDFDNFRFTAGPAGSINVEYESELESSVRIRTTPDCWDFESADWAIVVPCGSAVLNGVITPGADFVISVEPRQYTSPWGTTPAEYDAVLRVSGLAIGVPVEGTSWGTLKGMYR